MSLSLYLNVLGLCVGFMSAVFFSAGALAMTPDKIQRIATSYWDTNQHWGDSLVDQRADYVMGAALLLISFSLQLAGNVVPATITPAILQPIGCASSQIIVAIAVLLASSIALRNLISNKTKVQVREIQDAVLAAEEAEREKRRKG